MSDITRDRIERIIYVIRGLRVMLDSDLAKLYGVTTKRLNEQVKRNPDRFPADFVYQLTRDEKDRLRSQFATFKDATAKRKYLPYVFTEQGVAMLSSVLQSKDAINVNVEIMRTFVRLRHVIQQDDSLVERVSKLELDSDEMKKIFKYVFDKFDQLEIKYPVLPKDRNKIGLK